MTPEDRFAETAIKSKEVAVLIKENAEEASRAASFMKEAFEAASDDILSSLETLARTGSLEIDQMVEQILQSLAQLALEEFVLGPIEGIFNTIGKSFIGQRAEGGPVQAGQRYLVGEQGPEVFTPGTAGQVTPMSSPSINITIHAGQGSPADAIRRSEKQIAASIARAVRTGSASL